MLHGPLADRADPVRQAVPVGGVHDRVLGDVPADRLDAVVVAVPLHRGREVREHRQTPARLVLTEDAARVGVEEDEPEEVVARHGRRMGTHGTEK